MNWTTLKNNQIINTNEISTTTIEEIRENLKNSYFRPIAFFGKNEFENVRLYVIVADDKCGELKLTSVLFPSDTTSYESLTKDFPAFHVFEREFYEEFSIEPKNHPWLKPLRKNQNNYQFFEMKGEDVHEVAVGPIHAGVIEPGHFRFMCQGEKVYNLEIMLGYQNRGVEKLFKKSFSNFKVNNRLAESVCGDTVIGYNMAYSQLMEVLTNTKISERAEIIRRIALEMERAAIHIGDMGAIAGDMAYLMGASIFGTTRTLIINLMLEICGSRFGRGLIDVGGVNFDIDDTLSTKIINTLKVVKKNVETTAKIMLQTPSCISRMERTGTVSSEIAASIGTVGMAARSSGLKIDSRFDYFDKWYSKKYLNKMKDFKPSGDVYSRFMLRLEEVRMSLELIYDFLDELNEHSEDKLYSNPANFISPNSFGISIVEGWRGEIVHIAITGANSELLRYKIKDPSFNNWYALSLAVRNNGISDFPLCNKSFNLSYCGNDL